MTRIILTILAAILLSAGCTPDRQETSSGISVLARDVAGEAFDLVFVPESEALIDLTCINYELNPDRFIEDFIEGYNSTAAYDLSYHEDTEWVTSKFVALCNSRAADPTD